MSRKVEKPPQVSWFKKYRLKLIIYITIIIIVIFIFFLGVFVEFSHNIVQKNTLIYNFFKNVSNAEEISYYELDTTVLKSTIYNFIKLHFNEDDPNYIERVTNAYIDLFNRVPKGDRHYILYYIALCSVESHFKMSARSSAGAIGIAQVMWSIWGDVIQKNYGVSRESLYTSIEDNIYVGYMIWRNCLRQNKYDIRKANAGYLGADNNNYNNKINFRFVNLVNSLFEHQLNSKIKVKLVDIKS